MQTFETPGSVSLEIKLPSGRVVVATSEEPRTSVELVGSGRRGQDALEEVEVTASERNGRHVVRIEQKDKFRWGPIQINWGGDVEARITCPVGTDLELSGGSVELRADGELGTASVRTASGDVRLQSARGKIEIKTASGDVVVASMNEGSVATVSGDLEVGRAGGSLVARTVSGDAHIRSLDGVLALTTTSGDVELDAVSGGEVRVQTVSGDVRVGVVRGTRVWIDAASVSGDLGSELGLEDSEPSAEAGGAVVPLHVKTVSGDVSIVRTAAGVPA